MSAGRSEAQESRPRKTRRASCELRGADETSLLCHPAERGLAHYALARSGSKSVGAHDVNNIPDQPGGAKGEVGLASARVLLSIVRRYVPVKECAPSPGGANLESASSEL